MISPEAIDFLSVSTSASVLTLTSANGFPFSLATSARSWGYIPTHGPHQLPEKVSTTTLPRKSLNLNALPSWSVPSTSGTASPTAKLPSREQFAGSDRAQVARLAIHSHVAELRDDPFEQGLRRLVEGVRVLLLDERRRSASPPCIARNPSSWRGLLEIS